MLISIYNHENWMLMFTIEIYCTITSYIKRADDKHGKALQRYLHDTRTAGEKLVKKHIRPKKSPDFLVELVDFEPEKKAEEKIISALLYEHTPGVSYRQIISQIKKMKNATRKKIIKTFSVLRQNRRHRP